MATRPSEEATVRAAPRSSAERAAAGAMIARSRSRRRSTEVQNEAMSRVSHRSAESLQPCPHCLADPSATVGPEVLRALTLDELRALNIARMRTGEGFRHTVLLKDLYGVFNVPDDGEVEHCSYFGHDHSLSIVAKASCGIWLQLGIDCGRKYVDGFREVEKELEIFKRLHTEQGFGRNYGEALVARIERLIAEAAAQVKSVPPLDRWLPQLSEGMRRALRTNSREVLIYRRKEKNDPMLESGKDEQVSATLRGLTLFGLEKDLRAMTKLLERARVYDRQRRAADISKANHHALQKERLALSNATRPFGIKVEEARQFWRERNLAAALYRAFDERLPNNVTLEGNTIHVAEGGKIRILGSEGAKTFRAGSAR